MSSNSSWWWGSASGGATAEFERVLESCTSSNLPSSTPPPITDSLTLSDLIRSSAVTANYALKSLLKRLNHSNPNVQLLAIAVIDICVKNGGDGFLREVGSFQFSEDCAQIIRNPTSNRDVQEKLRREFQNWALAFEAVPFLSSSELVTNYRKLKSSGVEFPPKDPSATAAMVDSMSAPEWRDSDVCERCRTAFSFTNRKHHCRNCGGVFDGQCSGKKRSLPHFGVTELVRICDGCYRSLSGGISSTSKPGISSGRRNSFSGESLQSPPLKGSASQSSHQRSATFHAAGFGRNSNRHSQPVSLGNHRSVGAFTSQEDADLERAIALSLQDARSSQKASHKIHSSAISTPQPSSILGAPSKPSIGAISDENDPDLAAAIAASLRDVTQPSAPMPISPSESTRKQPSILPDPGSESINVLLNFSADVEAASRLGQLHPLNLDLRNRYVNVEQGLPHFNRAIESTERKAQHLKDMNDKLSEAVRMYDRLLSEQVMYRSQSALHSNPNPAASSTK
ncbi:hypothetical protein BY996DRAFT_2964649 [Phakopsora pachyrhizi]|nr:hypothetical protein BY996DRAFT_2964649 [Phakopsora pachyrhizi]